MDCIFCKIINKEIPATIVYEDDDFLAFHDINPNADVHILLVPKQHIETLQDVKDELLIGKMMMLAPKIAKTFGIHYDKANHNGGFKTIFHVGPNGGQEVYHLHLHILGNK